MEQTADAGTFVGSEDAQTSAAARVRKRRLERRQRKARHKALVVLCVVSVLMGIYAVGFSFFSTHFLPGTSLAGVDGSFMDEQELASAVESRIDAYCAHAQLGPFTLDLRGDEVSLTCDAKRDACGMMIAQDASSWPVLLFGGGSSVTGTIEFDEEAATKLVREAVTAFDEGARKPVPAKLALSRKKDEVTLKEERDGEALEVDAVVSKVCAALAVASQEVALDEGDLVQPAYRADSDVARERLAAAQETLEADVALVCEGREAMVVEADVKRPWLVAADDLSLGVDEGAVAAWADEELWQSVDHSDDQAAHVVDCEVFAKTLDEYVGRNDRGTLEVPTIAVPLYLPDGVLAAAPFEEGRGRYIDVDKAAQVATLFDATGRILWQSQVTTGNEASADGTPEGEYQIYEKVRDTVLIGRDLDYDGKPDYEHHVDYWMPFYGPIGLHDADWRQTFGGQEYREHGSGGCVNLTPEAAAALFSMTHVNEWVVVHS